MDNKLFKRIVAVAASAVMLTTSAFATVLTVGEDAWNDTAKSLTFSYDPAGATKVTYLAYAAREAAKGENGEYTEAGTDINGTKYVFGEIVAVNQLDGSEVVPAGDEVTVPVNDGLLTVGEGEAKVAATHIVLMSGADNSNTADTKVVALAQAPVEYTITFDVDGVTSTATTVDGKVTAPTAPTKDGFTFKGWGTTADATTVVDLSTEVFAADTTLYAIFEANAPTVKVTFKNGTEETVVTADATGKVALPTAPANLTLTADEAASGLYACSSLTFIGWTNADDTKLYTADITDITEDTTLYAKFDTGYVYGDVTGDGIIKPADRLGVNAFLGNGTIRNNTNKKLFPTMILVAGDVTGDGVIKPADRLGVNAFLGNGTIRNYTNSPIYYINKGE